jgi:hypothetical protein
VLDLHASQQRMEFAIELLSWVNMSLGQVLPSEFAATLVLTEIFHHWEERVVGKVLAPVTKSFL